MTKYSLESRRDDYEPEEGEIQDDDDDEQMEEVPSKTAGSTTSNKGTDRETCSKSFLLCRRDESKSCSRKSNCNTYGGKPYYTTGAPDDAFISSHSSRARYRTSPAHKWYHTHRQSSSASKEWGVSKSSMGSKERERRETKRTRNQYYSSFVHPPSDQRSASNITSGNSCFNTSIPPWHWYSKHVKDKNKKTSVSPSKITATMNHSSSKNQNQTNNSSFSLNSMSNEEPNTVAQNNEKIDLEKNYSHPGSPASTSSIEIIEVPPKIPEVITIYDSDEEPCKDSNENPKYAACSPKEKYLIRESQNDSPEIPQESSQLQDILQGNHRSNNIQEHTVQRNDEIEMQEFNSQQNNNMQEINLTIERSASSLAHIDSRQNNIVNQINKECATDIPDSHDNTNESLFDKTIPQAKLVDTENNVNIGENDNDYWGRNSEKNVCFDMQTELSTSQPTLNMNISEASHQGIQFPPLDTNVLLSSSSLSSPKHLEGYVIEEEYSSVLKSFVNSQAQMYPANSQVLDNNKTNENFAAVVTRDEPSVQHSIYSPTVFQADEIVTSHSDIHSSQNTKCLCQKHISISGYKSNAYIPPSLRINRNINYSVLKLIVPTNEKTNTFNQHNIIDNEITDKEKGEDNILCENDKEKNSRILNTHASHEDDQEKESPDISEKVKSGPTNNIIQSESSPNSRNKVDNTKQNATFQDGCNIHSDADITRNNNITDLLPYEHTTLSENTENVENSVSVNDSEKEKCLGKENTLTESVKTVQASSVAALKRRATELKKLHHSSVKKSENQKSVPSVAMNKQLRDTSFSLPSHHPSNISFHENDVENSHISVKSVNIGGISGYTTINSLGEKCLTYTSPFVYEDRIGTILNRENGPFNEQATKRNIVPEFIINLGKESDSGDDSDDKSSRSKSADDSTHEMKAEHKTSTSISKTINTDFEKKLEVLLKEARSQQESGIKFDKGDIVTSEEAASSEQSNRQNDTFTPVYTTFLHKNIQPSSAIQGCARAIPRSTVKKMASSKVGKPKTANHRIRSVVIKSFPGTVHQDRTFPNDRTIKHLTSATINSYKQANRGWSRNVANKGKVSRQTSSMGDIGLLPPLKQKEYMKLKRQLVQMTQKKRDIRNKERCESEDFTDRSNKQEESRLKQTIENTTNERKNSQEVTVTVANESNPSSTAVQATDQKSLQTTSGIRSSEIQINIGDHVSSESHSCHNHEQDENIIDREQNSLPPHNPIPNTNASEVITGNELIAKSSFQKPSLNDNRCIVFPHQNELSPTSIEKQTSNNNKNNNSETRNHNKESEVLSQKRKLTISTQEQVQKKQRTGNKESEISINELHGTNITETEGENPSRCKLAENLWSSETKLIASRRQVLEDIATVHLQLHKIEAANFRKDLLIKNINRLKDELKQSEEKLKQEEDCVKNFKNIIDNSKLIIQRGQSELLSLTLECEELGCKVHGPPNYNVPKTCADLIRNEMLAMTQAMQELEN